jgi:GNAT superfamily N-acetyltransferase
MSQPLIVVRDATMADAESLFTFNQALADETENRHIPDEVLRQGIIGALENDHRLKYWVACPVDDPSRPIGQLAVSYEWSDWRNGWIWWLQSVYVDAGWRQKGVFRALLGQVRQSAETAGDVIGLRLYVEHENAAARATYSRMGFQPAGYEVLELMWSDKTSRHHG